MQKKLSNENFSNFSNDKLGEAKNLKNSKIILQNTTREWTDEEKNLLLQLNKKHFHNWTYISAKIKTKTPIQCSHKLAKITAIQARPKFSRFDEITLLNLVEKYGQNWEEISTKMGNKFSQRIIKKHYFENILPHLTYEFLGKKKTRFNKNDENFKIFQTNISNNYYCNSSIFNSSNEKNSLIEDQNKLLPLKNFLFSEKINVTNKEKTNTVIVRSYKKLLKILTIILKLDHCCQDAEMAYFINSKITKFSVKLKIFCDKMKNDQKIQKIKLIEEMIKFGKSIINIYLNKLHLNEDGKSFPNPNVNE